MTLFNMNSSRKQGWVPDGTIVVIKIISFGTQNNCIQLI